jgi:sulfatase modifying factor 1
MMAAFMLGLRPLFLRRCSVLANLLFAAAVFAQWVPSSQSAEIMGGGSVKKFGPDPVPMVYVPAGPFLVRVGWNQPLNEKLKGVEWEKRTEDGKGVYDIRLSTGSYFIDRHEVSNLRYEAFMKKTGHRIPGFWNDSRFNGPRLPVVGVSFEDSRVYCKWAGKRLPTEAEWEKAARGTDGRMFPWGNAAKEYPNPLDRANFNPILRTGVDYYTTDFSADGYHFPAPVDAFPRGASPYGALQMAGNAAEWISRPYWLGVAGEKRTFPSVPGAWGIQKGGSWLHLIYKLRAAERRWSDKRFARDFSVGFRCARDS